MKSWLDQCKVSKDLKDLPHSGRRRATIPKHDKQIFSLASREMFATRHSGPFKKKKNQEKLEYHLAPIAWGRGKYGPPKFKPLITEGNRNILFNLAENHRSTDWDLVILSDETTVCRLKGRVWNLPGIKKVAWTVEHQNVWFYLRLKALDAWCASKKTSMPDWCAIWTTSAVSCQQPRTNAARIRHRGNYWRTITRNTCRKWQKHWEQKMGLKQCIDHPHHSTPIQLTMCGN